MDVKQLQAALMSKGIRVEENDPVFYLLASNEVLLSELAKELIKQVNAADERLNEHAHDVAVNALAKAVNSSTEQIKLQAKATAAELIGYTKEVKRERELSMKAFYFSYVTFFAGVLIGGGGIWYLTQHIFK